MDYRELGRAEYDRKLRMVIVESESLHAHAQDIGDNRATIGWGYTLNRDNNVAIWRESGIELTQQQWQTLAAVDAASADDRTRVGLTFSRQLNAAESDQLLRASMAEYEGPANRLQMPLSDERIALVSLAYNRGVGMLNGIPRSGVPEHAIMDAVRDGDRAEAWFQMRYNCWGSNNEAEAGLRKRRFAEAQVFGLYDDPNNVTPDEARNVYRMYQLHRDEIARVERGFGVTVEGEAAPRNRIAQANRDYPGLVDQYGNVPNIADALGPARTVLLRELRQEHPDLADRLTDADFNAGQLYLDPGRDLRDRGEVDRQYPIDTNNDRVNNRNVALRREQHSTTTSDVDQNHGATIDSQRMSRGRNPQEIASNDLLIGEGGNDTLRSHRGDDILMGGQGRDRMEGGEGRDTYVIDAGDTVRDSDGVGELRWGGQPLTGGARAANDPANTYRSEDGRFTYALENNNLSVTDTLARDQMGREPAVIENFQNGQLGITLSEAGGVARPQAAPPSAEEQERVRASEEDRGTGNTAPSIPAPALDTDDRQTSREPARGPFDDPYANSVYAALLAGDSNELDRIAGAFSRSPEGQRMAELGEQMLIQQQREAQTPLQDQQVQAREGPAMRM
ncbi:hemolysin [Pseudoxanthomonas sp. LH2527]|uniref:glycoside hydrolase family protein n=1 Tax=Pseudoxanthomonas sp. LH2527 TaxID=2923249 RepID=UPI001F130A6E|nr:hemolysin [Pseudoxanthomonas sp. LH2527]MCH6485038.1 hemolysin [Pseudoxanthomonas sp. LH2527]